MSTECWVVTDGRAGIENQALGLAEAVARRVELKIFAKRIIIRRPWRDLPGAFWGDPLTKLSKDGALLRPPYPDLLIGCGRLAAPVAASIRRRNPRTFVVQLQTPPSPTSDFDVVIPPQHDGLSGANVFPILGAPNRITPERLATDAERLRSDPIVAALPQPRVAALIGGPNRSYVFGATEGARIGADLAALAASGAGVMATLSRRTSPEAAAAIRAALGEAPHALWSGEAVAGLDNPYFGMLGLADHILVTEDSVNMAAEAATTGKPVSFLALRKRNFADGSKFERFRAALVERGAARRFTGALEHWTYPPLDETARAAAHIVDRFVAPAVR
jgi:hypothetical protein